MITIKDVTLHEVEALLIPVYEDEVSNINKVEVLKEQKAFLGKEGEVFCATTIEEKVRYEIFIGVGKKEDFTSEGFRRALSEGARKAKALKVKTLGVQLLVNEKLCVGGNVKAITEAMSLALYDFIKYKTTDQHQEEMTIYLTGVPEAKRDRAQIKLQETLHIVEGVIIARNLVNEPSNIIYPESLAKEVEKLGEEAGFEVEVMKEETIKELGMEAFLAVGMSSENKPRLIVMRYMGEPDSQEILGLVGKGLTYDTGGYSLKPTDSMKTMHSDMGGAGAVIGAMSAIAKNKVKRNIVAVVAACENTISGSSYKPGDIIGSMAGKSIEILNTDAEGRLTLADAVTYIIEKEKVTEVIDVATLTGAALVALGTTTTAVVTNNSAFYERLQGAAAKTGETFWELPNHKDYQKLIKSEVADLKNVGGRNAGTITAGLFIGEFVKDLPWLHLDIAGTSWVETNTGYLTKGATGVPVRTLYAMVEGPCGCGKH
ncbi:leucyl aminopeptidase [Sporanaerobium hydrogeniformans]|uniref:Leucyl aminopeptidase n=1 Tax=Sporanaerobium hydrogeniformans TaxID=3072179 RepID=A0AC61DBY9_9FIRM|nr:leucyl aminopeptidase [Sporanaerobium hydrogeniformans]PHV70756.1 leucyl aminopeptidase [Sporanaerobium hydrogeniformans]